MSLTRLQLSPRSVLAYTSILIADRSLGTEAPVARMVPAGKSPIAVGSSKGPGSQRVPQPFWVSAMPVSFLQEVPLSVLP